jgi:hypothetical protein
MRAQRIGDELRREPTPREGRAGGEGGGDPTHLAAPAQRVGREGHGGQGGQRRREGPAADVMRRGVRGDGGQEAHPDDDRGHREHVARADPLVQLPRPQHEQEHEAEGQCGLHDGQRGEQQRGRLQRPARQPQRGACEPARAARQARDERRTQPMGRRHHPRLEGLQRDAEVVHHRRRTRGQGAEDDGGHGSIPR